MARDYLAVSAAFGQGLLIAAVRPVGCVDKFVGGAVRICVKAAEKLPFQTIAKNLGKR
jgi:hypothetical protein